MDPAPNNNEALKGIDLEEADGNFDLDGAINFGDFQDFYYSTGSGSFFWTGSFGSTPDSRDNALVSTGNNIVKGVGPVSDDDLSDYLMTVDMVNFVQLTKNTMGYAGTDRAGPFTLAGGTFDDGGTDAWARGGRNVYINLDVRHSGMPNTARDLIGDLQEEATLFSVVNSTVYYGDLPPLASTTGSGSFIAVLNNPSAAFTWVPVTVHFADTRENFSTVDFDLPVVRTTGNTSPAGVNDSYNVDEDTTLSVPIPGVLANDSDTDGEVLTAFVQTGVSHGTLTLSTDGSFSYAPIADFSGSDGFTYVASDGKQ
jgi:hypothetical protein